MARYSYTIYTRCLESCPSICGGTSFFIFFFSLKRGRFPLLPMSSLALRFSSWLCLLASGVPTSAQRSFLAGSSPRAWSGTIHSFFTSAIFCLHRHPHASVGPPVQLSIQVWKVNHPIPSLDALLIFFKHLQQGTDDLLENRIWSICMCD